jgi:GR25 family glycosyltransferase involved in LPS biosynthesis
MGLTKTKFLIILIIILIIIKVIIQTKNIKEGFSNISCMVITLGNIDRLKNIEEQQNKNNIYIQKIDAVNGSLLNQDDLIRDNILDVRFKEGTSKRKNEIGCYLSHLKIYKTVLNSNKVDGITIVLEDDFIINTNNFYESIENIINELRDIDYDIVYLGNTFGNAGEQYKNNIYYVDKNNKILGTYGYLINNKNAKKIYELTKFVDTQIDEKINNLIKENKLNAFIVKPNIINHNYGLESTILS